LIVAENFLLYPLKPLTKCPIVYKRSPDALADRCCSETGYESLLVMADRAFTSMEE
jgi:hypothetical protein